MVTIEHEVGRYLVLLGNKIRERGFTQLEVQDALGWGRSYISQLVTRQKALRFEQLLSILSVLGIDPADFFRELYGIRASAFPALRSVHRSADAELQKLRGEIYSLTELLLEKGLIEAEDLTAAVRTVDAGADA